MNNNNMGFRFREKYGNHMLLNENNSRTFVNIKQGQREEFPAPQPSDDIARQIARGVSRYFRALNHGVITELPLADGRRCDVMAIDERGIISIVEIKSCVADFRSDQKWPDYRQWCDRLYFAVMASFPCELVPEQCGLILADRFGAEIVREAPEDRLIAARRKAITLRFGRAAAFRLQDGTDREFNPGMVV
jgi:hypothetical protein